MPSKYTVELARWIQKLTDEGVSRLEIVDRTGIPERTQRRWVERLKADTGYTETPPQYYSHQTDQEAFDRIVDEHYANFDEIRIGFMSDAHLPDHDPQAVLTALAVLKDFNPHFFPDLNDAFDFETVSTRFESSNKKKAQDVWEDITKPSYMWYHRQIQRHIPNAVKWALIGNHDIRSKIWLERRASQFTKTTLNAIINDIRSVGTYWLGWGANLYAFRDDLLLVHGLVANKNSAETQLKDYGPHFRGVIAGHVHRTGIYESTTLNGHGDIVSVRSVTVGGMQKLIHGHKRTSVPQPRHVLGFGLVTIDLLQQVTTITPLTICPRTYTVRWGGKVYRGREVDTR